jgi:hypothetical protein
MSEWSDRERRDGKRICDDYLERNNWNLDQAFEELGRVRARSIHETIEAARQEEALVSRGYSRGRRIYGPMITQPKKKSDKKAI